MKSVLYSLLHFHNITLFVFLFVLATPAYAQSLVVTQWSRLLLAFLGGPNRVHEIEPNSSIKGMCLVHCSIFQAQKDTF